MPSDLIALFVIHIGGAIVGIGPTFAFGILGKYAAAPGYALPMLEAMLDIQKKIVTPVALFTQPISGALLIFRTGRDANFFSFTWLWVSILLYAVVLYLSYLSSAPRLRTIVAMLKDGAPDPPELQRLISIETKLGPIFGIMTIAIIVLMIWKPGD